jgi:hypothetical protein
MKKIFLLSFLFFILSVNPVLCMSVHSINPGELYPGSEALIKGADFEEEILIILGDRAIKPFYSSNNLLKFTIPSDSEPGTYRLFLKTKTGMTYPIAVALKKREITIKNVTPDSIDLCGPNRRITISGTNLSSIKKIIVHGAEISGFQSADKQLTLNIPEETARTAVHVINIYLYDENQKIQDVINIKTNSTPVIERVDTQSTAFNFYDMKINGKNFVNGLRFFVNGSVIIEKTKEEQSIIPFEKQSLTKGLSKTTPVYDRVEYLNCGEIVYTRFPMISDNKKIEFYIENPSGERSNTYVITAP